MKRIVVFLPFILINNIFSMDEKQQLYTDLSPTSCWASDTEREDLCLAQNHLLMLDKEASANECADILLELMKQDIPLSSQEITDLKNEYGSDEYDYGGDFRKFNPYARYQIYDALLKMPSLSIDKKRDISDIMHALEPTLK
jgi:hypothetical protein